MFNDTKESVEFPAFHKKNIFKKSAEKETSEVEKPLDVKENIENKFEYPFEFLSWHSGNDFYPELDAAVEFYNQKNDLLFNIFKLIHPAEILLLKISRLFFTNRL